MAMSATTLGTALADKILDANATTEARAKVVAFWTSIATEIISHITTNAEVTVASGITVTTAGTAAAQSGSTTAPGTGTIS